MSDPRPKEVLDKIRELSQAAALTPVRCAELLAQRLQVLEECGAQRTYLLVGGDAGLWRRAELRWLVAREQGVLFVDLAEGLAIPMEETEAVFGEYPAYATIPPDPRDPDSKQLHVYPVPAGELRLVFPPGEPPLFLCGFVVDPFPMIDWSERPEGA